MKIFPSVLLFLFVCLTGLSQVPASDTFTNPLLPSGPDPWVYSWKGYYFFMATTQNNLTIWKTADITDLRHAEKKVIWVPEADKPWSKAIWAPELTRWNDKWYVYFAATDGSAQARRVYAIENSAEDPLDGSWIFRGKVADSTDRWAIDADVFEVNGTHYMLWSGWPGSDRGIQNIYIARMSNPWTFDSPRTLLSTPTYDWEKHSENPKSGQTVFVNEAPEALIHNGMVFVVFSASGCWTDEYELGLLGADSPSDLLATRSWKKYDQPFFRKDATAHAFGTGHNGFFKSPDGKEDWIIYHANPEAGQGCGAARSPRIQRFTWNSDGTPNFGVPQPTDVPLTKPSETIEVYKVNADSSIRTKP
jgi:GH43 family beta-xylosidase